jgi:hypothetical protein
MGCKVYRTFTTLLLVAVSCRTPSGDTPSDVDGVGVPTEEGIPISFISNLPAQVGHELYQNLALLVASSNPDGLFKNIRPMDISIACEAASPGENHCRLIYDGPEIKLKLSDLLFRSMSGNAYVRRGCKGQGCEKPPMKMWWRTLAKTSPTGEQAYDFEVCDIRGLEAGVSVNTPFALGAEILDKINYKPDIKGFRATILEAKTLVPITDDQGRPIASAGGSAKLEESITYKALSLQAGFGPIGPYPTANCLLKDDKEEAFFKKQKPSRDSKDVPLSPSQLANVPGNFVKFAYDITGHMTRESSGQAMTINMKCQDIPNKPVCEMRYKGPTVTIPIPKYITGIFDSEVQVLRKCENPGCKQKTEAVVTMTAYKTDQLETIEMCAVSGMEISTLKKLPYQERVLGAPDIKGMIMRIDPGSEDRPNDAKDPIPGSSATLKSLHLGLSGVGQYPTTRCLFVEN